MGTWSKKGCLLTDKERVQDKNHKWKRFAIKNCPQKYLSSPVKNLFLTGATAWAKLFFVYTGLLCYLLGIENVEQLIHSPFGGHIFENMVVIEKIKQFAEKGKRAPCYFYCTNKGDCFDAYEINFSSTSNIEMAKPLFAFKKEHPVGQCALLNLHSEELPFSNDISAKHWSLA